MKQGHPSPSNMVSFWFSVVFVVHLSLLPDFSAAAASSSRSSKDSLEFRCVTPYVAYNSKDSVKLYVQKQQLHRFDTWVSVNNGGSKIIPPFPEDRMNISVKCDVTSSPGLATCSANFTIENAQPIDAAYLYRCEIVSDAANDTTGAHSYLLPYGKTAPEHVDLKIIDVNKTALEYTTAGKVKIYEINSTTELDGVTVQCTANGTYKNPKAVHMDIGTQRHFSGVYIHTDSHYTGPPGNRRKTKTVTARISDAYKIHSMIGKDVVCTATSYSTNRDDIDSRINIRLQLPPEIVCDTAGGKQAGDSVELSCTVKGLIPGDDVWWDILDENGVVATEVRSDIRAVDSNGRTVTAKVSVIKLPGELAYSSWLNVTSAQKGVMYKIYSKNKFGSTEKTVSLSLNDTTSGISLRIQWMNVILLLLLGMAV